MLEPLATSIEASLDVRRAGMSTELHVVRVQEPVLAREGAIVVIAHVASDVLVVLVARNQTHDLLEDDPADA